MNEREEALVGTPHPNETPAQPAPESQMAVVVVDGNCRAVFIFIKVCFFDIGQPDVI